MALTPPLPADRTCNGDLRLVPNHPPKDVLDRFISVPAKSRGGRFSVDDVVKTINQTRNTFTKQEVIDWTVVSPGTINKALIAGVTAGTITGLGGNPKKYQPAK